MAKLTECAFPALPFHCFFCTNVVFCCAEMEVVRSLLVRQSTCPFTLSRYRLNTSQPVCSQADDPVRGKRLPLRAHPFLLTLCVLSNTRETRRRLCFYGATTWRHPRDACVFLCNVQELMRARAQ